MNNVPPVFKSKRFWSALASIIAMLIVVYVPEFNGMEAELAESITVIALFLIGGYTITDFASVMAVARKVAELTPTKKDDEFVGMIAGVVKQD